MYDGYPNLYLVTYYIYQVFIFYRTCISGFASDQVQTKKDKKYLLKKI